MFRTGLAALMCAAAIGGAPALAADSSTTIQFARGSNQAAVSGSITGYDGANFLVNARGGQTLQVSFKPNNNGCYINIYGRGNTTMYDGSSDGSNSYSTQLRDDGTYTIEAYLSRNEAKRGSTCRFTLNVSVTGGGGGNGQGASDDQMRQACQDKAVNQYDVRPSKIALESQVTKIRNGWSIAGTADRGRNGGVSRFNCLFDSNRNLASVQDLGSDQPQQPTYTLPQGGWSQSCRNASIDRNGMMYAQCKDTKNRWQDTQLDVRTCKSAENINGVLVCTRQ